MAAAADTPPLPDLARLYDAVPHARLLSNGRYTVLVTGAGSGYSAWNGYALTSWRADRTADADGFFLYLRDLERGALWSLGHQPVRQAVERYDAGAVSGKFWIEQRHAGIEARCEVCVAADADAEIRRLVVRNLSDRPRRIELTTYAEIALNRPAAHAAHPAFSKLFVQTEVAAAGGVLLARRRPRGNDEAHPWLAHALHGAGPLEYETDRAGFLGRYRSPAAPQALATAAPLSGASGGVLDPIFSLRRVLHLAPGAAAELAAVLAIAPERPAALAAAERYALPAAVADAFAGAGAAAGVTLRRLRISPGHADYLQELAGAMLYGDPCLRAAGHVVRRARGALDVLSRFGVRRDALLVVVVGGAKADPVAELVRAQAYWQTAGVAVDLLVLDAAGAVRAAGATAAHVIVRRRDELSAADRVRLLAAAQLVVDGRLPDLAPRPSAAGVCRAAGVPAAADAAAAQPLACDNGYGGFAADGREYVVRRRPPMPWINVVANESFGFLASERGAGYTWSGNSREYRLTPWSNDPVSDPHGEALYIRDDDGGVLWSPQPGPAPGPEPYEVRHGFGSTLWRYAGYDLEEEVVQFVARRDPVKLTRWRLRNTGDRPRRLSLCAYYQLVLAAEADAGRFVVTAIDPRSGAVLAHNRFAGEFSHGVVFAAAAPPEGAAGVSCTADRTAFIGRNGDLSAPAALDGSDLDGAAGVGLDPCAALQVRVRLPPGAAIEGTFLFGAGRDTAHARRLIARYRRPGAVERALRAVRTFWDDTLAAVQIETPARGIDLMVNGWLLYQVLSCRLWGRSAFYQSGGAFGFRDQLQDAAALIHARPDLTRAQIVLHAAHQFAEGDVLHWWHPPAGRGIRTRFSDDLLWLPYVTAFYGRTTGDWSVLDEPAAFLSARSLAPGEDEALLQPLPAGEVADVYQHCCRALDRALTQGAHGLPLMGSGDWNDGMNRVGRNGRGESVWLGFFLFRILEDFIPLCARRGDAPRVQRYRGYRARLGEALEEGGWDGGWYRRAYYDDGTPLGSAQADECRIDALVQAWAVLSGAAPPQRAAPALAAVERYLVSADAGLIRLLAPPFDRDPRDPGYIKGYIPGIRENGGQYTHAAVWVAQALAELGWRDRAAAYLEMLGPVHHTRTAAAVGVYQVEPYVLAADIYGLPPHLGRGGWTWYTGSAGWMYRVAIESILGVRLEGGDTLWLRPRVPDTWPEFRVRYRLADGRTRYDILARNPDGCAAAVRSLTVDGTAGSLQDGAARIPLVRDGRVHHVVAVLGGAVSASAAPSSPNT